MAIKSIFYNNKLIKNKKGDLEFDELGKLILMGMLLITLIVIVGFFLKDKLYEQLDKIETVFRSIFG